MGPAYTLNLFAGEAPLILLTVARRRCEVGMATFKPCRNTETKLGMLERDEMAAHTKDRINPQPFDEVKHGCAKINNGMVSISSKDELGWFDSKGSFWGNKGQATLIITPVNPDVKLTWHNKLAQAIYCQLGLLYGHQIEEPLPLTVQVRINRSKKYQEFDIETWPWPYGGWYGGVDKDGIPVPREGVFIAQFIEPASFLDYILAAKAPKEIRVRVLEVSLKKPQRFDLQLIQNAVSSIR